VSDSIEDYRPSDLVVVSVEGHEVIVDSGDEEVAIGDAVRFANDMFGRVVELTGAREVVVQVFDSTGIESHGPVTFPGTAARLPEPSHGTHQLKNLAFVLEGVPFDAKASRLGAIDASRPPVETGSRTSDLLAPLVQNGVNLIINESGTSLLGSCRGWVSADIAIGVTQIDGVDIDFEVHDAWEHLMAMRVAAAWAAWFREHGDSVTFLARLPSPESAPAAPRESASAATLAQWVNEMGEILVSTQTSITSIFEVDVSNRGIAAIAETMDFGEVDAQWFIDADGNFDPTRSTSRAELRDDERAERDDVLAKIRLAAKARERAAIFGEIELSDEERDAIDFADQLGG